MDAVVRYLEISSRLRTGRSRGSAVSAYGLAFDLVQAYVAHVFSFHQINDVLGDVLCVIAHALDRLGCKKYLQSVCDAARIGHHIGDHLPDDRTVFVVYLTVLAYHFYRSGGIEPGEGGKRFVEHVERDVGDMAVFHMRDPLALPTIVNKLGQWRGLPPLRP